MKACWKSSRTKTHIQPKPELMENKGKRKNNNVLTLPSGKLGLGTTVKVGNFSER